MNVVEVKSPSNSHLETLLPFTFPTVSSKLYPENSLKTTWVVTQMPHSEKGGLIHTRQSSRDPSDFNALRTPASHARRYEMASTQADRRTATLVLAGLGALESEREKGDEDRWMDLLKAEIGKKR